MIFIITMRGWHLPYRWHGAPGRPKANAMIRLALRCANCIRHLRCPQSATVTHIYDDNNDNNDNNDDDNNDNDNNDNDNDNDDNDNDNDNDEVLRRVSRIDILARTTDSRSRRC
jgi:hypothetical protein